eukprot:jgi/Chlat1/890/Chrsp107S01346
MHSQYGPSPAPSLAPEVGDGGGVFHWGDILTLVVYFAVLAGLSFAISKRQVTQQAERSDGDAYFLAERSVPWWAVAASLFASNIGAEHFVGLAGTAAHSGIAVGWYEWGAMPCLLALGYFFLPVYMTAVVTTMPDWVERRYNGYCRTFLVVLSLILYVFTKISATLYAGQILISALTDINGLLATLLLILATAVYTVLGGLAAVIYTEALQTVVLVAGGLAMLGVGLSAVDGLSGLKARLSHLDPAYFQLLRSAKDPQFPWTGFVFGYYTVIVQRALAAKNIEHGRGGCVGGAMLKLLPGFIMVLPGMIARSLMEERGVVTMSSARPEFDKAFPWMVMNVMPPNSRGLLVAAMISALMSSLASRYTTERELVWMGRLTVVVVAMLSILWLPFIPLLGDQLFLYIQKPPAFVAPPIFALFLWGMLWKRVNAVAGSIGLTCGVAAGLARFVLEIINELRTTSGRTDLILPGLASINFLHFASINFAFTSTIILAISFVFPRPEAEQARDRHTALIYHKGLYGLLMREDDPDEGLSRFSDWSVRGDTSTEGVHKLLAEDENAAEIELAMSINHASHITSIASVGEPHATNGHGNSNNSRHGSSSGRKGEERSGLLAAAEPKSHEGGWDSVELGGDSGSIHSINSSKGGKESVRPLRPKPRYKREKWVTDAFAVGILVAFVAIIIGFK